MIARIRGLSLVLVALAAPCGAAPPCADSIRGVRALLGDAEFPLRWRETTMDDGKPLVLSIRERDGALFLSFMKGPDGMWAEGTAAVCAAAGTLQARFSAETLAIGPAAHWAMRYTLSSGVDFTLDRVGRSRMRIGTVGWSGMFAADEPASR